MTDGLGPAAVMQMFHQWSESDDLLVDLRPDLQLWSRALGSHWENEIVDTSGRNELSPKAGRPLR